MRAYRITDYTGTSGPTYAPTLAGCREAVRKAAPPARRHVEVAEVAVAHDKEGIVALLNRTHVELVVKRWQGTVRGGLRLIQEASSW